MNPKSIGWKIAFLIRILKLSPLWAEYCWDGWHYRRYTVPWARGHQSRWNSTLKWEEAQGSWPSCLYILTHSLLLQIGHSSPFSTTVHTIGLIYGAILHILGALIVWEVHTRPPHILNTEWLRVFWMTIKCIWEHLNILIGTFQLVYKVHSNSENKIEQWAALLVPIHSCISLIAFASIWLKVVYVHDN
jgi:hypothetical protein